MTDRADVFRTLNTFNISKGSVMFVLIIVRMHPESVNYTYVTGRSPTCGLTA